MSALILRHAFSDFHGLAQLGRGEVPDVEDTRRRIFLAERRGDQRRPDHFYKGYLKQRLGAASHVAALPQLALSQLAERYLERRDDRVLVRYERFGEWHQLLPYISPLYVVVAFLVDEGRGPSAGEDPWAYLEHQIGESALLGTSDYHLEDLVERNGLNELHMHLNGSTELEILWADAVSDPDAFYRELDGAWRKSPGPVAELYDQMEPGLAPYGLYKRLRAARRVRWAVARFIADQFGGLATRYDMNRLIAEMAQEEDDLSVEASRGASASGAPASVIFGHRGPKPLIDEAAWVYASLQHLSRFPGDLVVGTGLYFVLLVLAQVRRLSVQQADESGFDQFQKYTLVGTRESLEKRYVSRFRQLNIRSPFDTLAHLEGRFSPKDTVLGNRTLIGGIVADFQEFAGCRRGTSSSTLPINPPPCLTARGCPGGPCTWEGRRLFELSLVGHFIKRPRDPVKDTFCGSRDSHLRLAVDQQARALKRTMYNSTVRSLLGGIDGAANELHAGAEPFATAFRIARHAGIPRATFHAGEDFYHLIGGMRAVEEAITFLDLRSGDRIGHATALGIDPALWLQRAGSRAILTRGDLLDDAVFAHRRLSVIPGHELETVKLSALIARHSAAIYGVEVSPTQLHSAWEMRCLDPSAVWKAEKSASAMASSPDVDAIIAEARHLSVTAVDAIAEAEFAFTASTLACHRAAYPIFRQRHQESQSACDEQIEVDADMLSVDALCALQDSVLGELNRRGIAIEALPTSNLRISYYESLEEHHIFRWLGLCGPHLVNLPTVVIGSDDPGIFATNLKNEYAVLASALRTHFGKTADEASLVVRRLNDASRMRRFRPTG